MKRLLKILLVLTVPGFALAASGSQTVVNEAGLTYSNTYPINLNQFGTPQTSAGKLAAQVTFSSVAYTNKTFTDGSQSTGAFTVTTNSGLLPAAATDKITVAASSVLQSSAAYASVVVNSTNGLTGATLTVLGNVMTNNGWRIDLASNTAADIATQLNAIITPITATSGGSIVTLVAKAKGLVGNTYTIVSSTPTALTVSSATFIGGKDSGIRNQSITVNGFVYTQGKYWDQPNTGDDTSTGTAASLATLINTIAGIQANSVGSVVYATATVNGTVGNTFTLVSSTPAAITVAAANFAGGVDQAQIIVNGIAVNVSTGASTTVTASQIATAINANSALSAIVKASNTANVVTTTSTATGVITNYSFVSSTPSAIAASGATMTGGTNAGVQLNSGVIALPAHGFTKALQVLYTGTPAIGGLTTGTTYFVVVLDANDIGLSSTSAVAQTGAFIVITATNTQTTAHTYTLAPLAFTQGPAAGSWQVSNDCTNGPWVTYATTAQNVTVSSQTFTPVFPNASSVQDFGFVDFACLRYSAVGPTQGGIQLKVILNAKD